MTRIYLDYNATTPIADPVTDAMIPFLREHFGNPSSSHSLGRTCKDAIEQARGQVAALIGAQTDEIYFTSGGTESNNLTIKGTFLREDLRTGQLVTSVFEHPAIKVPAEFHRSQGGRVTWLPTDQQGVVDLSAAEQAIQASTGLVSVMHANNEIGTVQPIRQIAELCRRFDVPLHTDAAQSVGKIRVNVDELGVDFLTIAGHKLYAPKGIGALYIRRGKSLVPSVHGAGHERGVRPGTENVPYIVGLGLAASQLMQIDQAMIRMKQLRDRLEDGLLKKIPGLSINGREADRLPNTSSLNFPGVVAANMLAQVPELCVSTGAACHSDTVALSDTLRAIGLRPEQGAGTVRISCGKPTTEAEIDEAVSLLVRAWEQSPK